MSDFTMVAHPNTHSTKALDSTNTTHSLISTPSLNIPESSIVRGSTHHMLTRSKASIVKPNSRYSMTTDVEEISIPSIMKEALAHPGWFRAMKEKLDALQANDTRELVLMTGDMQIIGTKCKTQAICLRVFELICSLPRSG